MGNSAFLPVRDAAVSICRDLQQAGFRAVWAGGCVRDMLMGRPPADIDIATNALPDQVAALFPGAREVGKSFGVVLVERGGHWFEVATFRRDLGYTDGRRPVAVEFADEMADVQRRDFTINGMLYDPVADRVVDLVGGRRDLEARLVRAIGNPDQRFAEDYLRMLRAVRFAAQLNFEIDRATFASIQRHASLAATLAAERIATELTRMLTASPRPGRAVRLLHDTNLLSAILPEVAAMAKVAQKPEHHPEGDVFDHTIRMLELMERPSPELAFAVLLHDVGKPVAQSAERSSDGTAEHFHGHDVVGAAIAEAVLRRLRCPNRRIELVTAAVRNHMRYYDIPRMRLSRLRRWMASPEFDIGLEVHRLDQAARGRSCEACATVETLRRGTPGRKDHLPAPLAKGEDVLALGVPKGPAVGRWLRMAADHQLENPQLTREEILAWLARQIREEQRQTFDDKKPAKPPTEETQPPPM